MVALPNGVHAALSRRSQGDRPDGAGDGHLRRERPSGLLDLRRTAARRAARSDLAAIGRRDRGGGGPALLRSRRRRPGADRRGGAGELARGAAGAGRQHTDATARAAELAHARQDVLAARSRRSLLALRLEREYTKEQILELYLNKMYFGDGPLRRRGRGAWLFRQAGARPDARRGRADCRPGQVAVDATRRPSTWTAPWPAATSCCRRCATTGAIDEPAFGRRARPRRSPEGRAPRSEEPFGQYFKEASPRAARRAVRLASASTRAASRSTRRSTWTCRGRPRPTVGSVAGRSRRSAAAQRCKRRKDARVERTPDCSRRRWSRSIREPAKCGRMVGGRNFEREPFQSRRPGAAPAGLGVQAVRLRRGARAGLHAGDADRPTSTSRSDARRAPGCQRTSTPRATR